MKKLDLYLFTSFIKLFFATFFICLLIVILQFMWLHINDLVGKGLPFSVLIEFFFYATLSLVPLALPLSILLASLMTFGDLGETLELTAMKSAGIPLFRIMRSLFIFISFVVVGAFFFSNNVIPIAQKRMWALMFSIRQKSPDLDIPVGEFYDGVNGMKFYVRSKDRDTKALIDVMIYDLSQGFSNASVTTADSAWLAVTADKKFLELTLKNGEAFENLKEQTISRKGVPYRRETFSEKVLLIDFNSDFNKMDEAVMADQHVSKNITKLSHDIDSSKIVLDSLIHKYERINPNNKYYGNAFISSSNEKVIDSIDNRKIEYSDVDTLIYYKSNDNLLANVRGALSTVENTSSDILYTKSIMGEWIYFYTRHSMEWHRKFTLSFACLIFFFIGAPLGAIIRKGGLGMPVVVSVVMFIIYYIIDTTGNKMCRDLIWEVWQGMWLSSAVLLPIGIFLTYKAATDSELFNAESYKKIIVRYFKKGRAIVRKYLKSINKKSQNKIAN